MRADWRTSGAKYWDAFLSRVNEEHVAPEMHKCTRFSPDPSAQVVSSALPEEFPPNLQLAASVQLTFIACLGDSWWLGPLICSSASLLSRKALRLLHQTLPMVRDACVLQTGPNSPPALIRAQSYQPFAA